MTYPHNDSDDNRSVPHDESTSIDDYTIGDVEAPTDRDADRIQSEYGFRNIPPGTHVLVVKGFRGAPERDTYRVTINGRQSAFNAARVKVIFCLPGDQGATVEDNFLLPPDEPRERAAYFDGAIGDGKPGFQSNKFLHFIDRIGFPFPPGGKLPDEARRLGNWRGRRVVATIKAGTPWTGNDGKEREGYPQIKLFSYEVAPPSGGQSASRPAAQGHAGGRPAMAGAGSTGGAPRRPSGLDDI